MSVEVTPHLNFQGEAREALEFYQTVFGGEAMIATYGDFGAPEDTPDADRVVFGQVTAENGFRVMAYDVPSAGEFDRASETSTRKEYGMTFTKEPFFLSLRGADAEEISSLWEKLSEGATVIEPLAPSQYSPLSGMLADRFGITWAIDVAVEYSGS